MIQEDDRSQKHSTLTRHERAVLALLQYPNVPKAAEALGIHPATLWRWLKNPALQKKLNEARRQQFSQNVGRLQQGCNAATSALFRIMTDEHCAAGSRVRAAESILRLAQAGLDREDLLLRISNLERAQKKQDLRPNG